MIRNVRLSGEIRLPFAWIISNLLYLRENLIAEITTTFHDLSATIQLIGSSVKNCHFYRLQHPKCDGAFHLVFPRFGGTRHLACVHTEWREHANIHCLLHETVVTYIQTIIESQTSIAQ
jgi:hypothetical protein